MTGGAPTILFRRFLRAEDGATLVEYALILPAFLALVLGLMQLGAMAWTASALNFAVQEAARCGALQSSNCATPDQVQAFAASEVTAMTVPSSAFTVTSQPCGTDVKASVAYSFINSPYWTVAPTLTAEACHP